MDTTEELKILRQVGFTEVEISKLSRLREIYNEEEIFQTMADYRRLEFVRWLVQTKRLTDQAN